MAYFAEIMSHGTKYLAVKDSSGRKVLRWIGKDYSVRDIRKAIRDFKIDLSRRRRNKSRFTLGGPNGQE